MSMSTVLFGIVCLNLAFHSHNTQTLRCHGVTDDCGLLWGPIFVYHIYLLINSAPVVIQHLLCDRLCGFEPFFDDRGDQYMFKRILNCEYEFVSPWWDNVSLNAKDLVSNNNHQNHATTTKK